MLNGYHQFAQQQITQGKKAAGSPARWKPFNQRGGKNPKELLFILHFPLAFEISKKNLHEANKLVRKLQSKYHKEIHSKEECISHDKKLFFNFNKN